MIILIIRKRMQNYSVKNMDQMENILKIMDKVKIVTLIKIINMVWGI
jgi:hypothetical protein